MVWCVVVGLVVAQPAENSKLQEQVVADAVLLETLVLDAEGRTVTGLTAADFELAIDGKIVPIDSLDVFCPIGAVDDVVPVDRKTRRTPSTEVPRKIVLLFDYITLNVDDRARILEEMMEEVRTAMTPKDEFMVASLTGKLRVEQRFTGDPLRVVAALTRMKHDKTLFAADFSGRTGTQYTGGTTGKEYLGALATLMDVLEPYEGAKAIVMYSTASSRPDVTVEEFEDIGRRAASARTIIYPARTAWMKGPDPRRGKYRETTKTTAGVGLRILPVLADGTGGRVLESGQTDLSLSLARAQRDLGCRHTVGFDLDEGEGKNNHKVGLRVKKEGHQVYYPIRIKLWSEEERRVSRLRAAFADPENFENALVRAGVFPLRPAKKGWDTLVMLHFPMPNDGNGNEVELDAALSRPGARKVEQFTNTFTVEPSGEQPVPVTILGDAAAVKPGPIELTIALSRANRENVVSALVATELPELPTGGDFLTGPVVARVLDDGLLIRSDRDETQEETALDRMLATGQSIEPLLIHDVETDDRLLLYWQACSGDKKRKAGNVRVERTILAADGTVAHRLDGADVALESVGKLGCGGKLDEIPAGTLTAGEYDLRIQMVDADGKVLAGETTPLMVH